MYSVDAFMCYRFALIAQNAEWHHAESFTETTNKSGLQT